MLNLNSGKLNPYVGLISFLVFIVVIFFIIIFAPRISFFESKKSLPVNIEDAQNGNRVNEGQVEITFQEKDPFEAICNEAGTASGTFIYGNTVCFR